MKRTNRNLIVEHHPAVPADENGRRRIELDEQFALANQITKRKLLAAPLEKLLDLIIADGAWRAERALLRLKWERLSLRHKPSDPGHLRDLPERN